MTDPYPLDEVVVKGQRAKGPSPFANLSFPSTGLNNIYQNELSDVSLEDPQPTDEQQQCSFPEGKRQWDADAKAREAIERFRARAAQFGEPDLQNREFGALICEFADGTVDLGPIVAGDPILDSGGTPIVYPGGRPTVDIPTTGCAGGITIGYIHSHPGVNTGIPSDSDFAYAQWLADFGGAPTNISIYVVSSYQDPIGNQSTQVSRSGLGDREAANQGAHTPSWINPDALPCPPQP